MDISKLKAFVCVAKWQSFTKAAAELYISQPALSKKISDFEKELGAPLLLRDNRMVKLTSAGKLLYDEAPAFLRIADDLERKVQDLALHPRNRLIIGCTGIEQGRIVSVVEAFRTAHPEVSILMHRYSAVELKRMVRSDLVDVGFQTHFETEQEREMEGVPFCRDKLAVIMSKNHPLAHLEEVTLDQLRDEVYFGIQPQQNHMPFVHIVNKLCEIGYDPREIQVAASLEDLLLSVSCGLGIAHLFAQTKEAHGGLVHYARCKDPNIDLQIDLVWNRGNMNPATRWFRDLVVEQNRTSTPI